MPSHTMNIISLNYPISAKTINKPELLPDEFTLIQQNTHHAQSLLQCLVMAFQGSDQRTDPVTTFTNRPTELRRLLAGFTYSHMDLFRLTNNDNLSERLIFDVLVEIIASYKRYLGKWPDFLEKSPY